MIDAGRDTVAGWLIAVRIARREARRSKGRSALAVALIGLPVLAGAFVAASYDMFDLTVQERLDRRLGTADARLAWVFDGPVQQDDVQGMEWSADQDGAVPAHTAGQVRAELPDGSRVSPRAQGELRLTTSTGVGRLRWYGIDLTDRITRGIAEVTNGRAPAAAGEVALTDAAADRLGARVGDRVEAPDGAASYAVVGLVEFPGSMSEDAVPTIDQEWVVFHPEGWPEVEDQELGTQWLVDTPDPVDWDLVQALNERGIVVHSRAVALDPPDHLEGAPPAAPDAVAFGAAAVVAGLVCLEVVLLAAPAFAVGARRRQHELAQVAAGGGTPAQLRRIVLAEGLVLGAFAAVAGIGLGVGAALAGRPLIEEYLAHQRAGGYRVFPLALAALGILAVGTGLLAALVPAITAGRLRIVDALAGRRGVTRSRRRWLVLGLSMVVAGAAIAGLGSWRISAGTMLSGLVLGQLGLVLCTPALVGMVARLGSRLPPAARMALRDTARNRFAAAPAISAVMAAVAGAVTAGVLLLALDDGQFQEHVPYAPGTAVANLGTTSDGWRDSDRAEPDSPDRAAIEQAVRDTLPVEEVHQELLVGCPTDSDAGCPPLVTLVPDQNLCPYSAARESGELTPADERAAAGDPRCTDANAGRLGLSVAVDDGTRLAALTQADPDQLAEAARVLRDGGAVVTHPRYLNPDQTVTLGPLDTGSYTVPDGRRVTVPGYLLDTELPRQGAIVAPAVVRAAGLDTRPGNLLATTSRLPTQSEEDAFVAAIEGAGAWGWVERPAESQLDLGLVVLAGAAAVVALGAASIATGLAATDRQPDLSTLGAIGASPRVRRALALSQSGVIAGLGTTLGLLAGLGAAVAVLAALNQRYASTWPSPEPYPILIPWQQLALLLLVPVVAMLGAGLLTRSRLPIERRPT